VSIGVIFLVGFIGRVACGQTIVVAGSREGVVVNGVLSVSPDPNGTVEYKERSISSWIARLIGENSHFRTRSRYSGLVLETETSIWEEAANVLEEAIPLIAYAANPHTNLLSTAGEFGAATNADLGFKRTATRALYEIIDKAVPTLIEKLKNEQDNNVRRAAAGALKSIELKRIASSTKIEGFGKEKLLELDKLVSQLLIDWKKIEAQIEKERRQSEKEFYLGHMNTPGSPLQEYAVIRLAHDYPEMAVTLLPELIRIVQNAKSMSDRLSAIDELGDIGSEAQTAIPVLTEITKESDKEMRKRAMKAIEKINKAAKKSKK
jgi:hypothetical protein